MWQWEPRECLPPPPGQEVQVENCFSEMLGPEVFQISVFKFFYIFEYLHGLAQVSIFNPKI
jgi:hypothetical protein